MTQIALFGTSADPPTIGHQAILKWLGQHYDYVAVWAADNPFKHHGASLEQRSEMLRLVINELNFKNVVLHKKLSDRRSLNTVKIAKEMWGEEAEYLLVIGSDLITQIPRWYRAKDLLQEVTLLIFPRKGYPLQTESLEQLTALKSTWIETDYNPPGISSSEYRVEGKAHIVIPAIADYIATEKLYQFTQ